MTHRSRLLRALPALGAALLFLGASEARAAGADMEVEEDTLSPGRLPGAGRPRSATASISPPAWRACSWGLS